MSKQGSIRVENLSHVTVSRYRDGDVSGLDLGAVKPFRVLFIKPFQNTPYPVHGPALGILTLIAVLREQFGALADIHYRDMKLYAEPPEEVQQLIEHIRPDVVAVSALNMEAQASFEIARWVKTVSPATITAIGGPFTLRQSDDIFRGSDFDWVFEGAADRTFANALGRQFSGLPLGDDIPGFSYRCGDTIVSNHQQDLITDLDAIPIPAWDMHDFETSRTRDKRRIITNLDEHRYAYLFTSRGCPYLCNYCHDIFTKRFVYQSEERVIQEMTLLRDRYGVEEFHFVDDIFNLHRPRAQAIMSAIHARWGSTLKIAFPNGLRGDILDQATIDAMVKAGTYNVAIAIETVTPRLQEMVEKHLDVDKSKWAIEEFSRQGVIVHGAFMYGFPTETPEEIEATLSYAVNGPLLHAHFFSVVPQKGTPIYEQALQVSRQATETIGRLETEGGDYNSAQSWYQLAYGYPLRKKLVIGIFRFYFHPRRMLRFLKVYGLKAVSRGLTEFVVTQFRTIRAALLTFRGMRR